VERVIVHYAEFHSESAPLRDVVCCVGDQDPEIPSNRRIVGVLAAGAFCWSWYKELAHKICEEPKTFHPKQGDPNPFFFSGGHSKLSIRDWKFPF
jgi:hypothetical protein